MNLENHHINENRILMHKNLKKRIKADILDDKLTSLSKEHFPGLLTTGKKGTVTINEAAFEQFYETIGGADIEAGWVIAQNGIENSTQTGKATDDNTTQASEKTGFAAASTTTKLGMVGTALTGIGLLATSGKKEPEPGQKGQEKQSNFWPNVKKFLGIAALLGAGVWAWKISQQGKASPSQSLGG